MEIKQSSKIEETPSSMATGERYNAIYTANNIDTTLNSSSVISCIAYKLENISTNIMENIKELITPDNYYVQKIYSLPNVKAIISEEINDILNFITILDSRNLETREAIYDVELQMYDLFKNQRFDFLTIYLQNLEDLANLTHGKNRKILYFTY